MTENETAEPAEDAPAETEESEEPAEDVFAGDDPKAKFREALSRKAGKGGKAGGEGEGGSKIGSAHGPAKAQRTFRRKSGG
jgi:hypothetical protein